MAIIVQTKFETIPVGEYVVEVADAMLTDGKFGDQVEFLLRVAEGPHENKMLKSWTSASFSPKSRLYSYAQALFGNPIPPNYDLDTGDLVGRRAIAVVLVREKPDGAAYNKIDGLRALGAGTPPAPAREPINDNGGDGSIFPPNERDRLPF